jgi:hypothetical protein
MLPPINQNQYALTNGYRATRQIPPFQQPDPAIANSIKALSNSRGKLSQLSYTNDDDQNTYRSRSKFNNNNNNLESFNQSSRLIRLKDLPPSPYDPT